MKRFLGIAAFALFVTFAGQNASAQNLKLGHINSDELIKAMPEYDSATVKLEKTRKELVNALELMTVELNNKADAYSKEMKTLTDLVKQAKEQELQDMQKRIQDFQNNAQTKLQEEQSAVFQPIIAKADKAMKDVGKEGSFVYIFDVAKGPLVYFDEAKSINVMSLVKAKLGLK
jgi:outer membrane protein